MTDNPIAIPPVSFAADAAWRKDVQRRYTAPWRHELQSQVDTEIEARYASATPSAHRARATLTATTASAAGHLHNWDRERIVTLCQDLARNNPVARSVIARKQEFTVGNGPTITSASEDAAFNEESTRLFNDCFFGHGEETDRTIEVRGIWNGVQILNAICKAWDTDGDCLLINTPTGIQVFESLLIRSANLRAYGARVSVVGTKGQTIVGEEVDGIVRDPVTGKHLAYRLCKWDGTQTMTTFVRYQEADENTLFLANPSADWIGAVRGEPALQALWEPLTALESFIRNSVGAAELATFFAALVTGDGAAQIQAGDEAQTEDQPDKGPNFRDLSPLLIHYLPAGTTVTQINPNFPQIGFGEFVKAMARVIGAEAAIPDAALLFDGSSLSWSNIKALMALAHARRKIEQDVLIRAVRWMRTRVMPTLAADAGLDLPDDWKRCEVVFGGVPVLSLGDEVSAWSEMVDKNFATHEQACQNFGTGSSSTIIKTRGKENREMEAEGVLPTAMPGQIDRNAQQAQTNGTNE